MEKNNRYFESEYPTPTEHSIPKEQYGSSSEFTSTPDEYFTTASEYTNPPDEYQFSYNQENSSEEKKEKPFAAKNKLVYFVASAVASFVVFSASLGGGLFGPGNSIIGSTEQPGGDTNNPDGDTTNPDGDTTNPGGDTSNPGGDTTNPGGDTSNPDGDTSSEDDSQSNVPGAYKGIFLTGNFEILGAKNNLIAFYSMEKLTYGLMNYEGELIFEQASLMEPYVQGPNAMGYTTFYGCGEEFNNVEVRDSNGKIVHTRTDGKTGIKYTQLGDCDIVYELISQEKGNPYVKYTKLDGTVIFDSRQHTDKKVTGYPFHNGQALVVIDTANSADSYYTLWVIDYSGNIKQLPDIMPSHAEIFGGVDEYFVLRSDKTYALVETSTGTISNWLDLEKYASTLGNSSLRLSSTSYNGISTYHYETYGILNEKYIFNFKDITSDGLLSTVVPYEYRLNLTLSPYLLAGSANYNAKEYHFIDWEGNVLTPLHSFAVPFNDSGYALVSDNDTDLIHVYNSEFEVVETLPGIVYTTDCGDFASMILREPTNVGGYYYYGELTETNTKYNGPIARHAGHKIEVEIPTVDPITYVTMNEKSQLKTLSAQLDELRAALSQESNSNLADRNQTITAIKQILTSSEALYFIACTNNATMKNYATLERNYSSTNVGLFYLDELITTYESKQSFPILYRNYLGYHTGPAAEALVALNEHIPYLEGKELTELQTYALSVAGDLLQVFKEHKTNLEKLFTYTDAFALTTTDSLFLKNYETEQTDIDTYWELIPELDKWELEPKS